jgi:hypothetical protein
VVNEIAAAKLELCLSYAISMGFVCTDAGISLLLAAFIGKSDYRHFLMAASGCSFS